MSEPAPLLENECFFIAPIGEEDTRHPAPVRRSFAIHRI
jgi:hypothetical protein